VVAGLVLGTIGWPRQSFLPTPKTNPEVLVWWALSGCLVGFLGAAAAVGFWNTIVLPVWLLRYTTAPLAKVALGLGLLFNGMALFVFDMLWLSASHALQAIVGDDVRLASAPLLLNTIGTLLAVLGPILCLEIAPKSRSGGVLLWAVVLRVSALVIGANPSINEVRIRNFQFNWDGLLDTVSLLLFLVFLQRLTRALERPELELRARSILKLMVWGLGGMAALTAAPWLGSFGPRAFPFVVAIGGGIVFLIFLRIFLRSFGLIRGLQTEIMQRL
jgi:hypothetical protein